MEYLLLIYENEKRWSNPAAPELAAEMKEYEKFGETFGKVIKGGNALQPTRTATSVRLREGKRLTTDGPFAETKEQLGGYYLIEAPDLDAALEAASKIPAARVGTIEVRPIMKFGEIALNDVARLYRAEWGRLLAALIRALGDFDVAEEALQEAFALAVTEWATSPPRHPSAWLYGTARHKAIDVIRRRARFADKQVALATELDEVDARAAADVDEEGAVPDERLRLIFTCCHPALAPEAQVALTLRTLCGLTTEEIAHAFLLPTTTMAQRLVRAKAKIRDAAIPYRIPAAAELPERLAEVMAVVYLVFNEGYAAAQGDALVRGELCAEAIRLAHLLRALLPAPASELDGLLAMMLLCDARRHTRVDGAGELVLLAEQDRSRWDRAQIDEGRALVQEALRHGPIGPYALEAAIAAVHAAALDAAATDWRQICALYARLFALHPSPVVALNRAVAIAMAEGPERALPLVDAIADALDEYHLLHATRADLLRRLGRREEAAAAYRRAHALTQNETERRFLRRRIDEL